MYLLADHYWSTLIPSPYEGCNGIAHVSWMVGFGWQLSNEKTLVWLFDIGDEILPSYIGIIINHYKDPC